MTHPGARKYPKGAYCLAFLALLFSALNGGKPPGARAQGAGPASEGPQQAAFTLDGVGLSIQASALPSGNFAVADPGAASQVATSASWRPFREFSVTAIPFGSRAGTEALPAAAAGHEDIYRTALREYRLQQGGQVTDGPAATLFGRQVTGIRSSLLLHVDGPVPKPVLIEEWVVEAGNRLWIVRGSEEGSTSDVNAQAVSGLEHLTLSGSMLDQPSTAADVPVAAAGPEPGGTVEAAALATPAWWNGDCDYNTYHAGSGGVSSYRLGEVYLGMPACGPRPWSDGGPDVLVRFYSGSWGEYEWECVELAMRFLYLMYGVAPYGANGSQVVWNYSGSRLVKVSNGTPGQAPQPNDVLSYGATSTAGHTAVVTASSVDVNGNGTVIVIEQNSSASGRGTLTVSNWTVSAFSGAISGWLHDPDGGGAPPPTFALSDDFNRPDGPLENDWLSWAAGAHQPGADLLNGELRTYGSPELSGGISRNLPVTFPLTFSFDFRTENALDECATGESNDGGWRIAFNSAGSSSPSAAAAQLKFEQTAGSQNITRRYVTDPSATDESGMASDAAAVAAGQRDFGHSPAHIQGTVYGDLSAAISIDYNDGNSPDPLLVLFAAAPGAIAFQPGPLLVLANSNCSAGPHVFDNFQLGPGPRVNISGNAGAAGVTLSYTDAGPHAVTADASGNYSFPVSYGWSGAVTPSKTGVTFTPSSRSYTSLTTDRVGQDYHAISTRTFTSDGSKDGWIRESSETSALGGTMNPTATTIRVGDHYTDAQYRAILSFDTSFLPDNAVITQVTLRFKKQAVVGSNPFGTHGALLADIRKGSFSGSSVLQLGDFQVAADRNSVLAFANTLVNGWYSRGMAAADFAYIKTTGATQFRLRFATDDNDDRGTDYLALYSGNAASADRPQLIIQYYVP